MATPITEQNFNDSSMDSHLVEWLEKQVGAVRVNPEDIRLLAGKSASKTEVLNHASAQMGGFNDERVILKRWHEDASKRRHEKKASEERQRKELHDLEANNKKYSFDNEVVQLSPGDKTKIWMARGVSIVLLVAGYVSMTTFLHEQMGWTWLASVFLPLIGVLGGGLTIKLAFDHLGEKSLKWWSIAFFVSIILILGLSFRFVQVKIMHANGVASVHDSISCFNLGMLVTSLSAGVAWAYSDRLIRKAIRILE